MELITVFIKLMSIICSQMYIVTMLLVIFFIFISNLATFGIWYYKEKIIKKSDDFFNSTKAGEIVFVLSNLGILIFVIFLSNKFKNILRGLSNTYINENWVSIIIGVTALIIPLIIQIWSESDKLKKVILNTVFNINNYMYISLIILFVSFFKILPIFLIGFFLYIIFSLYQILKLQSKLKRILYYPEEINDILNILKWKNKKTEIFIFYKELEKLLFNNIKNEEIDFLESYIIIWEKAFEFSYKYMESEEKEEVLRFIYDVYRLLKIIKNESIFTESSGLHIKVASVALQNKEMHIFSNSLVSIGFLYEYYIEKGREDKLKRHVINGMIYTISIPNIIKEFNKNLEDGIKWCACYYSAINNCIIQTIEKQDKEFFYEFVNLLNFSFTSRFIKKNPKEYILLKYSNDFGLLLMIETFYEKEIDKSFINILKEKIFKEFNRISYKHINNGIDGIEDVYLFIKKYKIDELLRWGEYFTPKLKLIGPTTYTSNKRESIDKLFLEFLYLEKDRLKIQKQEEEFIKKMIDKNNRNIIPVYSFLELIKKINVDDKKEFLNNLFNKVNQNIITIDKEEVRELKFSLKKIGGFIKVITEMLETTKINKIFSTIISIKKQFEPKHSRGYNYYLDKEIFVDTYKEIYADGIFEEYIRIIDDTLESIIVEDIYEKSKNNKINSLEEQDIKNGIIIVSGIYIGKLFNENKKITPKYLLNEEEIKKYGDYVEGLYDGRMPIYFFNGEIKGIFILEEKFIQEIKFFKKENNEIFTEEEIKKYIDIGNIGLQLEIESFEKFYEEKTEKRKEELLELDFLKEFNEKEEKLKHLKEQVLFKLYQEYEIVINEEKKVYQLIFKENDII